MSRGEIEPTRAYCEADNIPLDETSEFGQVRTPPVYLRAFDHSRDIKLWSNFSRREQAAYANDHQEHAGCGAVPLRRRHQRRTEAKSITPPLPLFACVSTEPVWK